MKSRRPVGAPGVTEGREVHRHPPGHRPGGQDVLLSTALAPGERRGRRPEPSPPALAASHPQGRAPLCQLTGPHLAGRLPTPGGCGRPAEARACPHHTRTGGTAQAPATPGATPLPGGRLSQHSAWGFLFGARTSLQRAGSCQDAELEPRAQGCRAKHGSPGPRGRSQHLRPGPRTWAFRGAGSCLHTQPQESQLSGVGGEGAESCLHTQPQGKRTLQGVGFMLAHPAPEHVELQAIWVCLHTQPQEHGLHRGLGHVCTLTQIPNSQKMEEPK